jgi:antitoxin HigA-1
MATKLYGFKATHPGEVLKDEIEYRGISQRALAAEMGISYNILNDILNCRRNISETTALLFEAALDIPADSILALQQKYNMQKLRCNKAFSLRLKTIRESAMAARQL